MDTNVYNNTPTPAPLQVLTTVFNQYMVTPSQQFDISSNEDGWGNMWSTLRARADVPSTLMYLCGLNPGVSAFYWLVPVYRRVPKFWTH